MINAMTNDDEHAAQRGGPSRAMPFTLGVTAMPEWFQHEGIDAVLDRVAALGADAIATSPYVLERCGEGEGAREPPPDGEAGKVRPLERDLFGARELHVRTAPAFAHDVARYRGLRYQPSPATLLTHRHEGLLDRVLTAAAARGIAVYLQVMAASPPGYRVQFSGAHADDRCLLPGGGVHEARVDRNASLASPHVVAYVAALCAELAERFPGIAGLRLDWPEYVPYDFRSALFDFNPAMIARLAARGVDGAALSRDVAQWADALRAAVRGRAVGGAAAVARAIDDAGFDALFADDGPLASLYAGKRAAALDLMRACRVALDASRHPDCRLEPQAFPPPLHRISGFPLETLDGVADAVGVKLYTMHWPMIARYWARDLLGGDVPATEAAHDAVTAALAHRFGFTDGLVDDGRALRYPEPDVAHPVGAAAQAAKLRDAGALAARVPVIAFAHAYGPVDDVVGRVRLAAAQAGPLWINRYGYLSDAKLAALAAALPRRRP